MQDRPSKEALLDALAGFLLQQVRPSIADPGLSFRVLIAANLATVVAAEIRSEEAQDEAELARLQALLPEVRATRGSTRDELHAAIRTLNTALCRQLRSDRIDQEQFARSAAHVKQTLLEKLAVNNPRFETASDIE
jgi:hypothetical protein